MLWLIHWKPWWEKPTSAHRSCNPVRAAITAIFISYTGTLFLDLQMCLVRITKFWNSNVLTHDMYSFRTNNGTWTSLSFDHADSDTFSRIYLFLSLHSSTTKTHRKTWMSLTFANVFAYLMTTIKRKCIFKCRALARGRSVHVRVMSSRQRRGLTGALTGCWKHFVSTCHLFSSLFKRHLVRHDALCLRMQIYERRQNTSRLKNATCFGCSVVGLSHLRVAGDSSFPRPARKWAVCLIQTPVSLST